MIDILMNMLLFGAVVLLFLSVFLLFKNSNTCANREIIIHAIFLYGKDMLNQGCYQFPNLYLQMESYDATLWRLYDWGYTRILPPHYYRMIQPYITDGMEIKSNENKQRKKTRKIR